MDRALISDQQIIDIYLLFPSLLPPPPSTQRSRAFNKKRWICVAIVVVIVLIIVVVIAVEFGGGSSSDDTKSWGGWVDSALTSEPQWNKLACHSISKMPGFKFTALPMTCECPPGLELLPTGIHFSQYAPLSVWVDAYIFSMYAATYLWLNCLVLTLSLYSCYIVASDWRCVPY